MDGKWVTASEHKVGHPSFIIYSKFFDLYFFH